MDRRLFLPRVISITRSPNYSDRSVIQTMYVRSNGTIQIRNELLKISHHQTLMQEGDIVDHNGIPFISAQEEITARLAVPGVERRIILYHSIRLTARNAPIQRFVLRLNHNFN